MPVTLEVRDVDQSGASVVRLVDLLAHIKPLGRGLMWAVLELHATGDALGAGESIPALEERISKLPHGLVLDWGGIENLAQHLDQVFDCVIVAAVDVKFVSPAATEQELEAISDFVIEAIDGTVWRMYCRHDEILDRILKSFHEVAVIRTK